MIDTGGLPSSSDQDVLGHLLHSLSQPLTTLRCSLELSLDEFTDRQSEAVCLALEQADKAIEAVRFMREYLEIEQGRRPVQTVALAPAVHAVLERASVLAEARNIPLLYSGTSNAVLHVHEFWLHRALNYLIAALLDDQVAGQAIVVLLEDASSCYLFSVHCLPCRSSRNRNSAPAGAPGNMRYVKLAIARRVLESAGGSLEFSSDDKPGLILRIPRPMALARELSA